jgi:nitrile hydratase beta subunit
MNGPHDMGGFTSFGPVSPERDEPVFHAEWERRAFGTVLAAGAMGQWNIDMSRHSRERIPATSYWASTYYEIWLAGLERLLVEKGLVSKEELANGVSRAQGRPVNRVLRAADIPSVLARGGPADRKLDRPARFKPGDPIRARNLNPGGHTRLPRYARGKIGEIAAIHGSHVFPDSAAAGKGDDPQWLYSVKFSVTELWGGDSQDAVMIDLWEPYLEPA